jgi:hypothetical protein
MLRRCHDPNHPQYADYGGRGIMICDRWQNDFWAYVNDIGPQPAEGMSVDRIDNDGNYEPGNCRWATPSQQSYNRRRSRRGPRSHCMNRNGPRHPMVGDNVIVLADGTRLCGTCQTTRLARRRKQ